MSKKRFEFEGMEEYLQKLRTLSEPSSYNDYVGAAIYKGAGLVADAVKDAINALPTRDKAEYGTSSHPVSGITEEQKAGLKESFGITKMRDENGFLCVKLGFDGYNGVKTKTWPNGQPNSVIARSIESGTSWLRKTSFMTRSTKKSKAAAEKAISAELDNQINNLMNKE